jgi:hypothetical protein
LAVANNGSNNVSVLLGNGDGTFQTAVNYSVGSFPDAVAVGSFNGKLGLAVANNGSSSVSVLLGNGDGTFQTAVNYSVGSFPDAVAVGDFNGDGKIDLAVANNGNNNVSVLLNNGDGTFRAAANYPAGSNPQGLVVGDFNGDLRLDLAVVNQTNGVSTVSVLLGNGDGSFQAPVTYAVGNSPVFMTTADLNGDGKLDLAVVNRGYDNLQILLGNGDGTFQPAVNYAVGSGPTAVVAGDFNGDGKPDLAVSNQADGNVTVLLNTTQLRANTTTAITAQTPDPSVVGQTVAVSFTVTPVAPATGTPTGNVTVRDGAGDSCIATVAAGSCSIIFTVAGTKTVTASYVGDTSFNASVSPGVTQMVGKGKATTAITGQTPNPSAPGQSVMVAFTVTAAAPATGTPTGNVTVSDSLGDACTATVAAGNCSIIFPTTGTKTLTASYAGDSNFNASVSVGVTQSVNGPPTTTRIMTQFPNPSFVGQPVEVIFSVTPVPPAAGTPIGNVKVSDGAGDSCSATVAVGRCSIIITTAGIKTLTATYLGSNFNASTSPGVTQSVNKAKTRTTITANSPNPSVTGQSVTVTFSVAAEFGGTPSGNVIVSDGMGDSCIAAGAAGACSLVISTAGNKNVQATYAGDSNFNSSTSKPVGQTVNADDTTTVISVRPNPSVAGQPVTVTFTVKPVSPGSGTPKGNVTVTEQLAGGGPSCKATVAAGSCSLVVIDTSRNPTAGPYGLMATYSGDKNYNPSTSANFREDVIDFSMSAGPGQEVVTGGQSAQYGIILAPLNGFEGTVDLSCQVTGGPITPRPPTCTINSVSLSLLWPPGGNTFGSGVTIQTNPVGATTGYVVTFIAKFGTGVPATGGLTHTAQVSVVVRP